MRMAVRLDGPAGQGRGPGPAKGKGEGPAHPLLGEAQMNRPSEWDLEELSVFRRGEVVFIVERYATQRGAMEAARYVKKGWRNGQLFSVWWKRAAIEQKGN